MNSLKKPQTESRLWRLSVQFPSHDRQALDVFETQAVADGVDLSRWVLQDQGGSRCAAGYYSRRSDAERARSLIQRFRRPGWRVVLRDLKAEDWQEAWKKSWTPVAVGRHFWVVPAWCRQRARRGSRYAIELDSTFTFGTGRHETTQMMIELMESRAGRFESFLDVGTGTGILAIAAARLGARTIVVNEIDAAGLAVAQANARRNGVTWDRVYAGDFGACRLRRTFDFVAANVVTSEILRLKDRLAVRVRPGGVLAVSGIHRKHWRSFGEGMKDFPLRCLKICRRNEWRAVLYQKIKADR